MVLRLVEVLLRSQVEQSCQNSYPAFFGSFLGSQLIHDNSVIHGSWFHTYCPLCWNTSNKVNQAIRFISNLDQNRDASCRWILTERSRRWHSYLIDFQRKSCHFCGCTVYDGLFRGVFALPKCEWKIGLLVWGTAVFHSKTWQEMIPMRMVSKDTFLVKKSSDGWEILHFKHYTGASIGVFWARAYCCVCLSSFPAF